VSKYCIPIWLSNWVFKDSKNKLYRLDNVVVKGYNKGSIFTDQKIVNKTVNKLIGSRSKKKLVPVNLTLISQHGYGVEEIKK
tara:strand:- start:1185 stop:1430 length:246 start_codon:yes stop_codon:yes gene_type:complete